MPETAQVPKPYPLSELVKPGKDHEVHEGAFEKIASSVSNLTGESPQNLKPEIDKPPFPEGLHAIIGDVDLSTNMKKSPSDKLKHQGTDLYTTDHNPFIHLPLVPTDGKGLERDGLGKAVTDELKGLREKRNDLLKAA